jgi:hypothetical protein
LKSYLPKLPLPHPAPWTTRGTSPSPLLCGMSRFGCAVLRAAPGGCSSARGGRQRRCVAGDGMKKAFIVPIRAERACFPPRQ